MNNEEIIEEDPWWMNDFIILPTEEETTENIIDLTKTELVSSEEPQDKETEGTSENEEIITTKI